jgi:signal transduction histidine kinase
VSGLRAVLRRHFLPIIVCGVSTPLLIILYMQYTTLLGLEKARPAANKALMRKYLTTVAERVDDFYRAGADQTLTIPPGAFDGPTMMQRYEEIGTYFRKNPAPWARKLFIGFTGKASRADYSIIYFYNPTGANSFVRGPCLPEWKSAHEASSHWLYLTSLFAGSFRLGLDPRSGSVPLTAMDVQADHVLTKPILDSELRVIGVTGMILDESFFVGELLPRIVDDSLPQFFPASHGETAVSLSDGGGRTLFVNHQDAGAGDEISEPLRFIFKELSLKISQGGATEEQRAHRLFALNISLSIIMATAVIVGVIVAVRTALQAIRLSEMKSDFVSNVSHELRTPLASIRVFGEFLRLGRATDVQKVSAYGEYIEKESTRLTQLINDILDFSRIDSGQRGYNLGPADINEAIREALRRYEVKFTEEGFVVSFKELHSGDPRISMDLEAISMAFTNLLDNAIKYSGASRDILITVGRKDEYIAISVTDFGIGIPQEEKARIFERFYRVGTGLVHDVKGSGLGLALVKHIVEAHSGVVTVSSKPGYGSTFTMYLPANRAAAEAAGPEQTEVARDLSQAPGLR